MIAAAHDWSGLRSRCEILAIVPGTAREHTASSQLATCNNHDPQGRPPGGAPRDDDLPAFFRQPALMFAFKGSDTIFRFRCIGGSADRCAQPETGPEDAG